MRDLYYTITYVFTITQPCGCYKEDDAYNILKYIHMLTHCCLLLNPYLVGCQQPV